MANGSRVPACPTLTPRPSRRRCAATTSCEVTPAGLSTRMTPSFTTARTARRAGTRPARGSRGRSRSRPRGGGRRRPGARAMTETSTRSSVARSDTLRLGDSPFPSRSRIRPGDGGPLDRAQVVDDALRVALVGPRGPVVLEREVGHGEQPAVVALDVREPARQQLELALRDALVEAAVDRVHVDPALDQLGRHLVGARAGVLVHEAPGVGHHADVQRLGDLLRHLDVEALGQVPHHLGRARGVRVDVVDGAEARVVVMVVDVEDAAARALERGGRRAVDVPAVQEHEDAIAEVVGRLGDEPVELDEAVLVRQRELVGGQERDRVLAERGQHLLHRGERADGVAVRALVRGEQELVVLAQRRERLLAGRPGAVVGHVQSPASRSSSSSIRTARSRVSS